MNGFGPCEFCGVEVTSENVAALSARDLLRGNYVLTVRLEGIGHVPVCGKCFNQLRANDGPAWNIAQSMIQVGRNGVDGDVIDLVPDADGYFKGE